MKHEIEVQHDCITDHGHGKMAHQKMVEYCYSAFLYIATAGGGKINAAGYTRPTRPTCPHSPHSLHSVRGKWGKWVK